ncbi:peptidoglycan-binding domain-containing protein [Nonomuraea basaltis]|uniref:peptidoglycan recognition protein family protein n=1 Tax=Nonomuraea basaltis TaxID=2495887 RepID=UPI00110C6CA1|nr:peptidoglycan-binding domain-containing protein [Nonomuraea basaltis]TMR92559.1 N-acetylmuramoyl-L-alanine amidase [Nonomuraea basaltis]
MQTTISPNKHAGRVAPIRVIVVHTMETGESGNVAENVAQYFARKATQASAHLCVDNNSVVQTVLPGDTAWAAPGCNSDGLQIELAGRAGQTKSQWADDYSKDLLDLAARQVAGWCKKYSIPAKRLTRAQLRAGHKGIVGHADVSAVYKRSDHWDPGPDFAWDDFISKVRHYLNGGPTAQPSKPSTSKPSMAKPGDWPAFPGRLLAYRPGEPLMSGADVTTWQYRLKQLRYTITVDGRYGPMTSAATKVFQRAEGLAMDGVVGPNTWRAAA